MEMAKRLADVPELTPEEESGILLLRRLCASAQRG